jgi:hypothetical protein
MSTNAPQKRFPFRVPEDYFDQSADEMTAAFLEVQGEKSFFVTPFKWLVAASVLVLVGAGIWLFSSIPAESSDCVTFACLLEQTDTRVLEDEIDEMLWDDSWGAVSVGWTEEDIQDITF